MNELQPQGRSQYGHIRKISLTYIVRVYEMEQNLWFLFPISSTCHLSVEKLLPKNKFREVRTCRNKGKQSQETM